MQVEETKSSLLHGQQDLVHKQTTFTHKDVILYVVFDTTRYYTYCSGGELLCNTRNPFRNYELKRAIYTNNHTTIYTTIYAVVEVCGALKAYLFFFSKLVCTSLVECCPVLYLSLLHSE